MVYRDRQGREITPCASEGFLHFLYESILGRRLLGVIIRPWFSETVGKILDSSFSCIFIDRFIKKNNISMADYVPVRYCSFNDFFKRKIKPSKRPVDPDENVFISPADGKLTLYKISDRLSVRIKGSRYSIKSFLLNTELSELYEDGYMFVVRLTPDDFHRYLYVASGEKTDNFEIPGVYHTVKPIAFGLSNVYFDNTRQYTVIDSEAYGPVTQIEVGALCVGRIVNHEGEATIVRGAEKGYFEFGGSTVIVLVQKGMIVPDTDIVLNSSKGIETVVHAGERIGIRG